MLSLLCMIATIGCDSTPETTRPPAEATVVDQALRFTLKNFEATDDPACATDPARSCATIQLSYPVAQGGAPGVAERINDSLRVVLLGGLGMYELPEANTMPEISSQADTFLNDFRAYRTEFPDSPMGWSVDADGKVLYEDDELVTLELGVSTFMGGAHPNSYVYIQSFDKQTGEPLPLDRLFAGPAPTEQQFRAAIRTARPEVVGGTESLEDAGFFWGEGFLAPTSYGAVGDSVYFYYNPYEIAAYAVGPTEFRLARK